ncbi:TPA: type II toxin-antitoxin system antitoxin HipB [Vibrio vulnificus]|uniref:type II toxin-antitoxin system antitoxin HipB n=1 Tax=Vibrio harveyi group TaxID=717610 RepID=UPI001B82F772|nr:type II toxin-antitoxin system antitoxin HipB [Vibrio parahaemolyticus]HBH7880080.1 type II toxin-antitoxin system antitoxin HipB [Vibrio parahaemolyticus]HDY7904964.1 type II toxin-antitoxin system antitoxin HipB [Vibrio vulnificus]HDY7927747.1 type II toxin-antitoxin system antitoxin HipB [Vibrio vulnificus]|tara:strand:+ start:251 stop:490 length:240 start_codon:yes stop_codon:yes gene_type:complete
MIYSPQQLANVLLLIRQKNGWTQSEVAKKVGIKQATISNFENKPEKATISTMFKIVQALDLTVKVEARTENKIVDEEDW